LSAPGEFSNREVPKLVHLGGAWRILFRTTQYDHSVARLARAGVVPECGTHYLSAAERPATTPWTGIVSSGGCGRTALRRPGAAASRRKAFLAWRLDDGNGDFVGELSNPMPVSADRGGRLLVRLPGE